MNKELCQAQNMYKVRIFLNGINFCVFVAFYREKKNYF